MAEASLPGVMKVNYKRELDSLCDCV